MKMTSSSYIIIVCVLLSLSMYGCTPLLIGVAIGGVGIYAVGKDTVQGDATQSFDSIWASALTVSKVRGEIAREDYSQGYIEFKAESNHIIINIIRLTRATNRLKISARKYYLPNQGLAQELFIKILEEAR